MGDGLVPLRVVCVLHAVCGFLNGAVYVAMAFSAPTIFLACGLLAASSAFWAVAAILAVCVCRSMMADGVRQILAIWLPCAACWNARLAKFSDMKESNLKFVVPYIPVLCVFAYSMYALTFLLGLPKLQLQRPVPWAGVFAMVGSLNLAYPFNPYPSGKLDVTLIWLTDQAQSIVMRTSVLNNEAIIFSTLGRAGTFALSCMVPNAIVYLVVAPYIYCGWEWAVRYSIFYAATLLQCALLCLIIPPTYPALRTHVQQAQFAASSALRARVGMLLEFFQSRMGLHSISLANMLLNATIVSLKWKSLTAEIRKDATFHQTDPHLTRIRYGYHIVHGMLWLPTFGAGFHALAILAEKYKLPQIDPYLRWTSMLKASMLWMKYVFLFFSTLKSGKDDAAAILIATLTVVTLVVFNIISLGHVFTFACRSDASKLYRWVSASFVVVDAVLLTILGCAIAGLPTLVRMIQAADSGMVMCLPGTYLFPVFALGNELSVTAQIYGQQHQAVRATDGTQARPHPQVLRSGSIHVLALQCSWGLLLNLVIDVVLTPAPSAAHVWGLLARNWIQTTLACSTLVLLGVTSLVSVTGEAHAMTNDDIITQDTGIPISVAPSTI